MNALCFIDLDGVLVDFVEGAFKHHNISIPWERITWEFPAQAGIGAKDFWEPLGTDFWAYLRPTRECLAIVSTAEEKFGKENVFLCSSPCLTKGCIVGKAMWIDQHLPGYTQRLILTNRKDVFSGPGRVLIDDRDENIDGWVKAGGIGILVPRPWNKIRSMRLNVSDVMIKSIEAVDLK